MFSSAKGNVTYFKLLSVISALLSTVCLGIFNDTCLSRVFNFFITEKFSNSA